MSLPYRRGVGAILFNQSGRVFVGRRMDTDADAWQLPQGGIKEGEPPGDAVLRELAEETGTHKAEIVAESRRWRRYDLPSEVVARVWGGRYRGQEQKWFALRFTGADRDIDLAATPDPEFDAWKWADLARIPDFIVPFKRRLYEDLVAEFTPLIAPLAAPADGHPPRVPAR